MVICVVVFSCNDENLEYNTTNNVSRRVDSILLPESEQLLWRTHKSKNTLSKGYTLNLNDSIENGIAYYKPNKNYKYKTIKVKRRSDTSKYFYVMIENVGVPVDTVCWAYGDNENNVSKYGRLYNWNSANALAKNMYMDLPIYKKDGSIFVKSFPTQGKIMSIEDFKDIIDSQNDTLPNKVNEYTITDEYIRGNMTYDAFVFGLDDAELNDSCAFHSLGGFRNTICQPQYAYYINGWYAHLNRAGDFWVSSPEDDYINPAYPNDTQQYHYVLNLMYMYDNFGLGIFVDYYDFEASITVSYHYKFGFSVRYVFEPIVREK